MYLPKIVMVALRSFTTFAISKITCKFLNEIILCHLSKNVIIHDHDERLNLHIKSKHSHIQISE